MHNMGTWDNNHLPCCHLEPETNSTCHSGHTLEDVFAMEMEKLKRQLDQLDTFPHLLSDIITYVCGNSSSMFKVGIDIQQRGDQVINQNNISWSHFMEIKRSESFYLL